jgi:hypothetical protein
MSGTSFFLQSSRDLGVLRLLGDDVDGIVTGRKVCFGVSFLLVNPSCNARLNCS